MKRVALYARCSTLDQNPENQLAELREYCRARGRNDVREFVDHGISGAREKRPALDKMMIEIKARRIDTVVVAAFDRLGRSVRHLVECLELFRHLNVEFISLREAVDSGSPVGQMVFTVFAAVAQLERSLVVERVKMGLRRAKAEGKRLGRPRLRIDARQLECLIREQAPARLAAKMLGISASSFCRLKAQYAGSLTRTPEAGAAA